MKVKQVTEKKIVRRILAFPGLHNIGLEVTSTCSGKRAVESAQFEINRSLGVSFLLKQNMFKPGTEKYEHINGLKKESVLPQLHVQHGA
jgi:hypothetical protein